MHVWMSRGIFREHDITTVRLWPGLGTYLLDVVPSLENDHAPPPVACCEVVPSVVELHGGEKIGCQTQSREMSTIAPRKALQSSP